ncbi:MAG: hypothetical protein WC895_00565 [Candidatus Shapirobacteria bacterium]|jgi:hypothetical protein
MEKNNLIKFLIPLIAALVVFESIVLVTNLDKGTKTNTNTEATSSATIEPEVTITEPVAEMIFETTNTDMKVGKSYKVNLNVVAKEDLMIDGIETYIKYDPNLMTISGLSSSNKLPKATVSKIDAQIGIIKNVVLIDAKAGYELNKGIINSVLSFTVTPKKVGLASFEISSGNTDKEFVTMMVENQTSKQLVFLTNKLDINAIK